MKHRPWEEVKIEEDRPSREKMRDIVVGKCTQATNIQTLLSVKRTFISFEERWFWTSETAAVGSVNDQYVEYALNDGHIDLLEE